MVGYFEAFALMFRSCIWEWNNLKPSDNIFRDFYKDLIEQSVITHEDLGYVTFVAIGLTFLRYLLTGFFLKPIGEHFKFKSKDMVKFPESSWKVSFYAIAFGIESYLLLWRYPEYLSDPRSPWRGWKRGMPVQSDIYFIYILEAGFYLHSIFATLYMDMRRKDSAVMILHHLLALSLIMFSLAVRYHRIGLLVLFLHDLSDVFLEFTKICTCFKNSMTKPSNVIEGLIIGGFLSFAVTWFVMRLYIYPLVVLFSGGHMARTVLPDASFYFFFNMKLWLLFLMNIWWFHFIVWLIFRIVTGKSKEVEDTRELSEEEKEELARSERENAMTNGNVKSPIHQEHMTTKNGNSVISQNGKSESRRRVVNGNVH